MTNAGTVTVIKGNGSNAVILLDKINNAGTLIESGMGLLGIAEGATLTNLPGAVIDLQGDGGIVGTDPHAVLLGYCSRPRQAVRDTEAEDAPGDPSKFRPQRGRGAAGDREGQER